MKILKNLIFLLLLLLFSCQNNITNNSEILKENKIKNKIILTIGDSITAGYNLSLEDSYPGQLEKLLQENLYNYEVVNAGVSGDTSMQVLERIDLYLLDEEKLPEIAILVVGGNDGLRGKSIEELSSNIDLIIKKLKDKNIKVVLGGMKIPPNLGLNYSRDFFSIYKKIAKNNDVYLINFFLEGVAGNRHLNLDDGIHPNKKGYEILAKNVFEFLKSNKLIKND